MRWETLLFFSPPWNKARISTIRQTIPAPLHCSFPCVVSYTAFTTYRLEYNGRNYPGVSWPDRGAGCRPQTLQLSRISNEVEEEEEEEVRRWPPCSERLFRCSDYLKLFTVFKYRMPSPRAAHGFAGGGLSRSRARLGFPLPPISLSSAVVVAAAAAADRISLQESPGPHPLFSKW